MIDKSDSEKYKKWQKAFWILLWEPTNVVGKWKQLILLGAVIGTFFCPFYTFYASLPYQGSVPPTVPLIKGFGRVVFGNELHGVKNVAVADFLEDESRPIRLQGNHTNLSKIKAFADAHPLESVYVEGFTLRDGSGLFWISYAATRNGEVLASQEQRRISLDKRRNWLGPPLWWMYLSLVAPLWLISFINIRKVRNSTEIVNDRKI